MKDSIVRICVHPKFKESLDEIQRKIALEIKKRYSLEEITINGTVASQFLAHNLNGKKAIPFKIRKVALNRGVIEFE